MTRRPPSPLLPFVFALALSACMHPRGPGAPIERRALAGTDGASHEIQPTAPGTRLTVLVFFGDHCPCQTAHDARLRELYALYHPRGVDFFAVDSEVNASPEHDAAEAAKRSYPFPILLDPGSALARSVGVEYSTEVLVVDRSGVIRYHGGIDSDWKKLHDDATPFLRDAIDDLLSDHPPRRPESKALGCALQTS